MAKLVRHLKKFFARTKGDAALMAVEVRHDVSVAGVDIEKLTPWFKLVKGHQLSEFWSTNFRSISRAASQNSRCPRSAMLSTFLSPL